MNILLTGGTGYIGSHIAVELLNLGHQVVIIDNLINSNANVIDKIEKITGKKPPFVKLDLLDQVGLSKFFDIHKVDAVIHLAGLKAVGESVAEPLRYYRNNLDSTLNLLDTMQKHGVYKLIFSSSATVYGDPSELPLKETSRVGQGITNPYGWTKYMQEQILTDVAKADSKMEIISLRYFNPVGAHASGLIGDDPNGIPANILPFVARVASGVLPKLQIFGDDYDTPDGTGVRDYIHVVDLAKGHIAALDALRPGHDVFNLGSGIGASVLEIIQAFKIASGNQDIPYEIAPRRPGDVASAYAAVDKAASEFRWRTEFSVEDSCRDAWNFIQTSK